MPDSTRVVGRYEILQLLGRGGMASVHLARQADIDRYVALKELSDFHSSDPMMARRFLLESRVGSALMHPNVVTVFDYFEHDGVPYIAMEYVPGGSLRRWAGHMTPPQLYGALEGVLAGLAHAQAHAVVHRDLKPENLLVTSDGRVKIADFGIAKAAMHTDTKLTRTGAAVGTPTYMAPEQAMAAEIGPWTDMYAVGVIAYELACGRVPFWADEPMAILFKHCNEPPVPVAAAAPGTDPGLSDWIDALLTKDPFARPASAAEAWDRLEDVAVAALGARWRREARLVEAGAETPRPLTPAPFEGGTDVSYETFDPSPPGPPPPVPPPPPPPPPPPAAAAPPAHAVTAVPAVPPPPEAPARRGRPRWLAPPAALAAAVAVVAAVLVLSGRDGEPPQRPVPAGSQPVPLGKDWMRGFVLISYTPDGYASERAKVALRRMRDRGATHVTLQPFWNVDDASGNQVEPGDDDELATPAAVEAAAIAAGELGLRVVIQPLGRIASDPSQYIGELSPDDPDVFLTSLGRTLRRWAELAERVDADAFVLGTELNRLVTHDEAWRAIAEDVRSVFDGRLTYGADSPEGVGDVTFWDALDLIGIEGPHETEPGGAAAVAARWSEAVSRLQAASEEHSKPVVFTFLGFPNRPDAARVWAADPAGKPDPSAQAAATEGAFRALAGKDWMAGAAWGQYSADAGGEATEEEGELDFWIRGRPAEAVIAAWHQAR